MPRNTLGDLNNLIFEQLERLNDEELDDEALDKEIKRSKATAGLAAVVVKNAEVILEAQKLKLEYCGGDDVNIPLMLQG